MDTDSYGWDIDSRWKRVKDFLTVEQAKLVGITVSDAVPVPEPAEFGRPADRRFERVNPIDEFDPSFPTQRVAPAPTPAPVDYSQCPRCAIRRAASRRKNDRQRAAKRAKKARAKGQN